MDLLGKIWPVQQTGRVGHQVVECDLPPLVWYVIKPLRDRVANIKGASLGKGEDRRTSELFRD
jgi:hypothetical protein